MWFFVWWPYALVHHLVPFFTDLIWTPAGVNMTWLTGIPLPSLVMWPLTASLGPITAYNILCLASLPPGAWSALLLCRYISRPWGSALLAGYRARRGKIGAAHIYFPYPRDLRAPQAPDSRGLMVIVFDRAQLESAARLVRISSGPR